MNVNGTSRRTAGFRSLPLAGRIATVVTAVILAAFAVGVAALGLGLLWRAVVWAWGW